MIETINIKNYRLFKSLDVERLSRVNLIAGKNNSGKTAFLEALMIQVSRGDIVVINDILRERDEIIVGNPREAYSLFNDIENPIIALGDVQFAIQFDEKLPKNVKYPANYGFQINTPRFLHDAFLFIPFKNDSDINAKLWELISLRPNEDLFVQILQLIEPKISKFRYDSNKPKVLLKGDNEQPMPLKKLGDGVERFVSIALALVNAKDKILLLDEFEVGLHYSIQKELWKVVFMYAKKWNIQVFVTTHSQDTIKAFGEVWNEPENIEEGNYFRLQRSRIDPENIEIVYYDNEMLEFADEKHLETR